MPEPVSRRLFSLIETRAVLPDGRVRTDRHSYPHGATYAEYRRIDEALVRSYGSEGSRTVGTFLDG